MRGRRDRRRENDVVGCLGCIHLPKQAPTVTVPAVPHFYILPCIAASLLYIASLFNTEISIFLSFSLPRSHANFKSIPPIIQGNDYFI